MLWLTIYNKWFPEIKPKLRDKIQNLIINNQNYIDPPDKKDVLEIGKRGSPNNFLH